MYRGYSFQAPVTPATTQPNKKGLEQAETEGAGGRNVFVYDLGLMRWREIYGVSVDVAVCGCCVGCMKRTDNVRSWME